MYHLCMDEVEADNRDDTEDVFTDSNYLRDEDLEPEAGIGGEFVDTTSTNGGPWPPFFNARVNGTVKRAGAEHKARRWIMAAKHGFLTTDAGKARK